MKAKVPRILCDIFIISLQIVSTLWKITILIDLWDPFNFLLSLEPMEGDNLIFFNRYPILNIAVGNFITKLI